MKTAYRHLFRLFQQALVKKEDLATLQKLQEEFASELATLRGRVDALDARTATLEKQQFSTTTKLTGEIVFGVSQAFGNERAINSDQQRAIDGAPTAAARQTAINNAFGGANASRDVLENATFSNRVRIALDTSFSGKDRLRTQLQARNTPQFDAGSTSTTNPRPNVTGTGMTRLGFDGSNNNQVELRRLEYRFPIGDTTTVFIGTGTNDGLEFNDSIPTLSPVDSSASGAISRFGRFNPIYRVSTGTGIIINQKLGKEFTAGDKFTLSLGYLSPTNDAQDPGRDRGFLNGSHAALAQLVYQPTPNFGLGFTYANAYYNTGAGISGGTGSGFANNPFNSTNNPDAAGNIPATTNAYGVQASIKFNPNFVLSGWAGLTDAQAKRQVNQIGTQGSAADPVVRNGDKATAWNWAVSLAFPDLFKEGSLGGLIFGMPPKMTDNDYGSNVGTGVLPRRRDRDTSYHVEGFYRYKVNDNVSITPGVLVILNPEHNSSNDTIFVGTVRTTFTF